MLGTPVDRAREHTSHRNPIRSLYWRSKARSPHWASVAAVPPGHVVRPRCSPMRIVAREESGCSRRIGSVQKDSAARPSPRGARIVSPLRCVPAALPSQGPRERRTGGMVSHPVEHRDERGTRRQAAKAVTAPTRFSKEALKILVPQDFPACRGS